MVFRLALRLCRIVPIPIALLLLLAGLALRDLFWERPELLLVIVAPLAVVGAWCSFQRIRRPLSLKGRVALGTLSIAIVVGLYSFLSYRQHQENPDDRSIPTWEQLWRDGVVKVCTENTASSTVWIVEDAWATFRIRLFRGLLVGSLLSVVLGLLMGCYPAVESFFLPPFAFLAKIPAVAMLPVFYVTVGVGEGLYVSMIAFGVVPSLSQTISQAAKKDVPDELLSKALTLGASQAECIWNVICRHILPQIIDGVRLQVGPAMVYLIAAEMLLADVGFGYHIRLQMRLLDMSVVYVYLIVLGAAGFLIDFFLNQLRRVLCRWYGH